MLKIKKIIVKIISIPFFIFRQLRIKYFNFYFINIRKILNNQVLYKNMPICNQKTYLTGFGKVEIGENCLFGYKLGGFYHYGTIELQSRSSEALIKIGNKVATNNNIFICAYNYIEIGDECRLGQFLTIMDFEAHQIDPSKRKEIGEIGSVKIGRNVWIGNNVVILKNSEVGENSIIAAGSIVVGKFPGNVIIGGVPAKIIKKI
jgi:acetyltransferase-like isoleucine patch superfamily enzyme